MDMDINSRISKEVNGSGIKERMQASKMRGPEFNGILNRKQRDLKFSGHAESRMRSRDINMNKGMLERLKKAVSKAEEKGGKDTLVLLSDLAFIVNVPNKTVVTAMEGGSIKDDVFTNIDSTVIST